MYSFLKNNNDTLIQNCLTYTEVIQKRTCSDPNFVVFRFLSDGINEDGSYTYKQLEDRSKSVAASLQKIGKKGDNVLLLFQPGLAYVASLYACFYSGFVAVPAYPPRRNRGIERIYTIIEDSGANICLLSQQVYNDIQRNFTDDSKLSNIQWIVYDDIQDTDKDNFKEENILPEDIALIQYTSGSTGNPKGVMLTQLNLMYNSEYIRTTFGVDKESVGVHWLPLFHDMGLIGGLLQAAYVKCVNINIPPMAFLKNPLNWLKAIDKYRGTIAGGPNFAFDYCIQKTTEEERKELDLSSMKVFFCGAEPIRQQTMKKFVEDFAISKIKEEMLYPCYGMAETTLIVTGGVFSEKPKYLSINTSALSENKVIIEKENTPGTTDLVSSGKTWLNTKIEIVNPHTIKQVSENEVGEIWISGPTVATGYYGKPEESKMIFGAHISDTNDGPFLRTGDLGFVYENELYITGRLKDIIIIRGVNYYPTDIEYLIQDNIPELKNNSGAVFPVTIDNSEKIVVVQELERTAMRNTDHNIILEKIRQIISEEMELETQAVVLIRTGSIPLTSSGKIQRRQTKFEYLNNELNIVAQWVKNKGVSEIKTTVSNTPTEENIKEWLVQWIMRNQNFTREEIDLDTNITTYGIDSLAAVTLESEIGKQFGFAWHVSSFMLNPTINGLAIEGMEIYENK